MVPFVFWLIVSVCSIEGKDSHLIAMVISQCPNELIIHERGSHVLYKSDSLPNMTGINHALNPLINSTT